MRDGHTKLNWFMEKTEKRQGRRASERKNGMANVPTASNDEVSSSSQKRHVIPLALSCVAGMILAFAGSKLLSPDRKKSSETREHTVRQGQTAPSGIISTASGKTYADLLDLDGKDMEGIDMAELNLICGSGLPGTEKADIQHCLLYTSDAADE